MSGGGRATGAIPDKRMSMPGEAYTRRVGADGFDNASFQPQPMFDLKKFNAPNRDGNPLTNNKHTAQKQDLETMMQQAEKAKQTAGLSDAARKEIGEHNIFTEPESNSGTNGKSPD